jgi:CheY-like chemotaxis protein
MPYPETTQHISEKAMKLLSEIPDPVIVTDQHRHVLYWNSSAERLYGLRTEDVLGHRLDVCCPELKSAAALNRSTYPPAAASNGSRQEVVLWAEDDDNDALLLARAWEKSGVKDELVRVRDGAEVICYLLGEGPYADREEFPLPRLLLLDINMPQKSGYDVIEWLQWQPQFRELPVVILTSSLNSGDVEHATRLRVKGYLVKPVDISEWIFKVQTVTSQCS